jgi:hypothetical protein
MAGRGRGWLLAASVLLAACAQAPQPVQPAEAKPEAVPPEAAAEPAAEPASPATAAEPAASAPVPDPTVIVIDPGGVDPGDVDLVAASAAERERRAAAPPASRSITNQNLVKAKPGEKASGKPVKPAEPAAAAPDGNGEAFWRNRSRELRQRWRDVVDEVADLESDADLLRRRFYAEADPYVRDGRIKPDWDRVLDRIRTLREEAERRREAVAAHLEEGRRAGALPGWLREGIDLEPAAEGTRPEEGPHEAVEPPIHPDPGEPIDDDGDGTGAR